MNKAAPPCTILWPQLIYRRARLDKNMNRAIARSEQVLGLRVAPRNRLHDSKGGQPKDRET